MKLRILSVTIILLFFYSNQFVAQMGNWVSHPFPSTYNSQPIARCGETVALCVHNTNGKASIFDIRTNLWIDIPLSSATPILDQFAVGDVVFMFSDSLLYGYSSIASRLDTVHYKGTRLYTGSGEYRGYQCGKMLALFATDQFLYIFDATDGLWRSEPITFPTGYSNLTSSWVRDDYAVLNFYRTSDAPKVIAYSLYHHAFNQAEYGPLPNPMMGQGYANLAVNNVTSKTYIGYSAITNQFSSVTVPVTGGNYDESGPHTDGGSVYAFYYNEVITPDVLWRTNFYCYSTVRGNWEVQKLDYNPYSNGYGGLHVGGEYASLLRTQVNTYDPLVWSAYTNNFVQFSPSIGGGGTLAGFVMGKNVFVCFQSNQAWGYDAKTERAISTSINGDGSSNVWEGKDFVAFATFATGADSMTIHCFNGNTMRWSNIRSWTLTSESRTGSDVLYAITPASSDYSKSDFVCYSAILDTLVKQSYSGFVSLKSVSGLLAYGYGSNQACYYDAQVPYFEQLNFSNYATAVSDSILLTYDNSSLKAYGYSALTRNLSSYTTTAATSLCFAGRYIGVIVGGGTFNKCVAYNGYYDSWIPLVPDARTYQWTVGGKTALIFHDNVAYAFNSQIPTTSVDELCTPAKSFSLYQNYPNPFNPTTKIQFDVPKSSFVNLKIYNLLGQEVATLVNEEKMPGRYEVEFNGSKLTSGVYYYRLIAGDYVSTKNFLLLK